MAKSNTLGDFAALHPDWTAAKVRHDNIREIVASHIVADEFKLPTLTFQEGYFVHDGQRDEKILSKMQTDFKTLEEAPVTNIKDGNTAVAITIVDGWIGDWDLPSTTATSGSRTTGRRWASTTATRWSRHQERWRAVRQPQDHEEFATKENVKAICDKITALSDQDIHDMVQRQGSS